MDAVVAAWRQANAAATASTSSTAQQSFVNLSDVREEDAQRSSTRRAAYGVLLALWTLPFNRTKQTRHGRNRSFGGSMPGTEDEY